MPRPGQTDKASSIERGLVPGYGARIRTNLAQALGLTVIAPEPKGFAIEAAAFAGEPPGELTVTRHTNVARDRGCCSTS